MEPENGEDILFGTCNIVAIIGSCFFIASLMKKDKLAICLYYRCEEFEKDGNVSVGDIFVQFAKNYFARCLVLLWTIFLVDIQVKCISASGECLSFTSNVAQVYLDLYGDLEIHKDIVLFVSIESKDRAYAVLKLTPFKKWETLAFFHRLGVFRKAFVHRIVFAKFEDEINSLADHMKDLFNSKTGRIGPKFADLGKVKEIFSKVRRVRCFGFLAIEYKGVRVSGLFPSSYDFPIKELLCGNRVAGWV
ncbi:hypothetical protein ACFX13_002675 [Malus domestica]